MRFHFHLYGGPRDSIFIYVVVHEILFLFIWRSPIFHFYVYQGSQDFIFVYMGVSRDRPWNITDHDSKKFDNHCCRCIIKYYT